MPFTFTCPALTPCAATFDVAGDAVEHARTAHPGDALPAHLPGSWAPLAPSRRRFRCRRCAAEVDADPGTVHVHCPTCAPTP